MNDQIDFELTEDTIKATKGEVTIEVDAAAVREPLNGKELDERWRNDAYDLLHWIVQHGGYLHGQEYER